MSERAYCALCFVLLPDADPSAFAPLCERCTKRHDPIVRMTHIVRRFPSLRFLRGVEPFNAVLFAREYAGRSHGEQCAIRFVLMIWNGCEGFTFPSDPTDPTGEFGEGLLPIPKFDLYEAWGCWDAEHWNAFREWSQRDFEFRP